MPGWIGQAELAFFRVAGTCELSLHNILKIQFFTMPIVQLLQIRLLSAPTAGEEWEGGS